MQSLDFQPDRLPSLTALLINGEPLGPVYIVLASRVSSENRRMADGAATAATARRAYRAIRSRASTNQPAIFAETLRDAPILPASPRLPDVPHRAARVRTRLLRTLPETGKIGSVAAVTTM